MTSITEMLTVYALFMPILFRQLWLKASLSPRSEVSAKLCNLCVRPRLSGGAVPGVGGGHLAAKYGIEYLLVVRLHLGWIPRW